MKEKRSPRFPVQPLARMARRLAVTVAAATLLGLGLASCVVAPPRPEVVRVAPPPPQAEIPPPPRPGHVWVGGHWVWRNGAYIWEPGHWQPVRVGYYWVPGHWAQRGAGWVWIEGHWAR
ncbi:YXWGXW repeat-containing protein [Achromobacter aloeverae]